jgi:hypothetical protein
MDNVREEDDAIPEIYAVDNKEVKNAFLNKFWLI